MFYSEVFSFDINLELHVFSTEKEASNCSNTIYSLLFIKSRIDTKIVAAGLLDEVVAAGLLDEIAAGVEALAENNCYASTIACTSLSY